MNILPLGTPDFWRNVVRAAKLRFRAGYGIAIKEGQQEITISVDLPRVRGGGSGGGGTPVETVYIVGLTSDKFRFRCKRMDENGTPTGDEFEVRAFSLPRVSSQVGRQDLTFTTPNFVAGDPLPIWWHTFWTGTAWVEDYWAVPVMNATCVS